MEKDSLAGLRTKKQSQNKNSKKFNFRNLFSVLKNFVSLQPIKFKTKCSKSKAF